MSKNTITRAQAIEFGISGVEYARSLWEQDADWSPEKSDEIIAVLTKMHEQLVKPRKAVVSKARVLNESLALKITKKLPAEGLTSKGIIGLGFPEVTTTQKAVAVMRVAEEIGLVERIKEGKTITFKPIADATPETFFPVGEPMGE